MEVEVIVGITCVVLLLALLFAGVHVAVALGVIGIGGLLLMSSYQTTASLTAETLYAIGSSYGFVLLPLFILMGHLGEASGAVEKATRFAYTWLGWLRGGLALATTASCGMFAAACGSSTATAAAIGKFVIPEMERYGYDSSLATGSVAASGTLGILIPPSSVLVIYGIICEESIGRLLIAGLLPGVMSAVIYMIGISLVVYMRPHLAPPTLRFSWKQRIRSTTGIWQILLLALTVIGGIYAGVFTPTEAGAAGAFLAFLFFLRGVAFRHAWTKIRAILDSSVQTTAMVFLIMVTAVLFGRFLTLAGVLDLAIDVVADSSWSPVVILVGACGLWTIMGCFMTGTSALLIVGPTIYTVLTAVGYNGIWLGIIMVKLVELAAITPPVGLNVYIVKGIAPHVPIGKIFRGIAMFAVMDVITIAILIAFPQISLWLPSLM